ncbi:MAG: hypothetical protein HYX62_05805 [Gammaproteobacteria bacterium]|nr:hypothetical protein [Gammaproteobacteria bacterium]
MNKGVATVRRGIPLLLEDAGNGLSDLFRALLARGYEQLVEWKSTSITIRVCTVSCKMGGDHIWVKERKFRTQQIATWN